MIKQITSFCAIVFGMLIFIEAVAHIFGLLGQIILLATIFVVPLVYGLTRNPYGLPDEVINNHTRR